MTHRRYSVQQSTAGKDGEKTGPASAVELYILKTGTLGARKFTGRQGKSDGTKPWSEKEGWGGVGAYASGQKTKPLSKKSSISQGKISVSTEFKG